MTLDEYQELAYKTCTPACYTDEYLDLGYIAEVGELAGKLAKRVMGDVINDIEIMLEIGDIAWFIAIKARLHGERISLGSPDICFYDTVLDFFYVATNAFIWKITILKNVCDKLCLDFEECLQLNIDKRSFSHDGIDFKKYLLDQHLWSQNVFGPGARDAGLINHIKKELDEINKAPGDIEEWVDVVILALEGALRHANPETVIDALLTKQKKNFSRKWPDWRTFHSNEPIEHLK